MPPSSTLSDATGARVGRPGIRNAWVRAMELAVAFIVMLVGLIMERDRLAEMRARIIDRRR